MFEWLKLLFDVGNDKCFEEHKNADGICYGLFGGDSNTGYLSETCIGCEHHTMPPEICRKENDNAP